MRHVRLMQSLWRKSVVVETDVANAFNIFAERHGSGWPLLTHHIGKVPAQTAVIEPRDGGRWFERGEDGSECEWGRVLVWDPPKRLVLAWQIDATWQYDPDLLIEVDVRFIAEGPRTTRVDLEHRKLENFGEPAGKMRTLLDGPGAWEGILKIYSEYLPKEEESK